MSALKNLRVRLVVALGAVGLAVMATTAATAAGFDGAQGQVTAIFDNASPMVKGNEVRAAGVKVGSISGIRLVNGRAQVDMLLDRSVLPLHTDARATITDKDLLGERFISLSRGSANSPELEDPAVLPETQTGRVVGLEEVLNSLDDPTSVALGALVTTLGEGMNGQGQQTADAIHALAPAMQQTDELSRLLSDQKNVLGRLVDRVEPVASAVATDHGAKLDGFVDATERTLSAVAANREATDAALKRLPATLVSARQTLAHLAGVSDAATPTLADIRPVTDNLVDVSHELEDFSDAADPALSSLTPVLKRGKDLLDEAAPLVRDLRPAGADLKDVTHSYRPLAEQALSGHLADLMEFAKGWALSTVGYDAIGHYFRAVVPATPYVAGHVLGGPVPGAPENPVPKLPVPTRPNLLLPDNSNRSTDPPNSGVTGLSQNQEKDMLGQMLGGK